MRVSVLLLLIFLSAFTANSMVPESYPKATPQVPFLREPVALIIQYNGNAQDPLLMKPLDWLNFVQMRVRSVPGVVLAKTMFYDHETHPFAAVIVTIANHRGPELIQKIKAVLPWIGTMDTLLNVLGGTDPKAQLLPKVFWKMSPAELRHALMRAPLEYRISYLRTVFDHLILHPKKYRSTDSSHNAILAAADFHRELIDRTLQDMGRLRDKIRELPNESHENFEHLYLIDFFIDQSLMTRLKLKQFPVEMNKSDVDAVFANGGISLAPHENLASLKDASLRAALKHGLLLEGRIVGILADPNPELRDHTSALIAEHINLLNEHDTITAFQKILDPQTIITESVAAVLIQRRSASMIGADYLNGAIDVLAHWATLKKGQRPKMSILLPIGSIVGRLQKSLPWFVAGHSAYSKQLVDKIAATFNLFSNDPSKSCLRILDQFSSSSNSRPNKSYK